MKTKELEKILKEPSVKFYDDEHPHPEYGKHVYVTAKGELYTGCTTISDAWDKSFFLGPWYAKEMGNYLLAQPFEIVTANPRAFEEMVIEAKGAAKRKSEQAKIDGTMVHDWIEDAIGKKILGAGGILPLPAVPEANRAVTAFVTWAQGVKATWLASEEIVCSDEHRIAGKLDGIAAIKGIPFIVDFKTSGQLSASYLLQLAGYDVMLREMGFQVAGYMIVRIPKDGKPAETLTITNREDMKFFRETFLKQREAHKFYVYAEGKFKDASGKMKTDPVPGDTGAPPQGKVEKPKQKKVEKPKQKHENIGKSVQQGDGGGKGKGARRVFEARAAK